MRLGTLLVQRACSDGVLHTEGVMPHRLCRAPQVQPALAYLSALKCRYTDHQQLWSVLMARAPPGSQQHTKFLKAAGVASVSVPQVGRHLDGRRQQPEEREAQQSAAMCPAADAAGGSDGSIGDAASSRHRPPTVQPPPDADGAAGNVGACAALGTHALLILAPTQDAMAAAAVV
jgi:hypothetical protein